MLDSVPHGERLKHGHPVILGAVPAAAATRFRQLTAVRGGGGSAGHVMGAAAQAGQGVGQGGAGGLVVVLLLVVGLVVRSQTILGTRRTGVVQYKQEQGFALSALTKVHKKENTPEIRRKSYLCDSFFTVFFLFARS